MLQEKPHYYGHRKRLQERFLKDYGASMQDYELLEMLLALAIPRKDVKPLAKQLLQNFGGFAEVIAADVHTLCQIKGVGENTACALKLVQSAASRLLQKELQTAPSISSWDKLLDYCHAVMAREKVEQARILFLDSKNNLITDEIQQTGTVNHTAIYPREVVKRALELSASAIIMVHNHPSGDPTPSTADKDMTHAVQDAGKHLGITLHDHVIIGKHDHFSFRSAGLLN